MIMPFEDYLKKKGLISIIEHIFLEYLYDYYLLSCNIKKTINSNFIYI